MRRNQLFVSLVFALIFSLFVFPSLNIVPIASTQPSTESVWQPYERGANYLVEQNSTDLSKFRWSNQPRWIWNGMEYVPYIFKEFANYYEIQTGLIGARLFKSGYAEFYNPSMTEIRLYEELWYPLYWRTQGGGSWSVVDVYSPVFDVAQDSEGVNITCSWKTDYPNNGEYAFNVTYVFRAGTKLDLFMVFDSFSSESQLYGVKRQWSGIVGDRVTYRGGESVITASNEVDSDWFLFGSESTPYSLFSSVGSMFWNYTSGERLTEQTIQPTIIDNHANGMKADFLFLDWTLGYGEQLSFMLNSEATFNDPTEDGTIEYYVNEVSYTRYASSTTLWMGTRLTGEDLWTYRSYSEWDITGIPDPATIITVVFKYQGYEDNIDCNIGDTEGVRPSTASDEDLYDALEYSYTYYQKYDFPTVGSNKQAILYSGAVSDLQSQLTSNWFAIGIISEDEGSFSQSQIYSEEYSGVNPPPTLYIEYYVPVYITLETDPTGLQVRIDEGTWYASPHTFEIESATSHSIECNPIQSGGTRTQYIWTNWNDTGVNPHNVAPTVNTTYVATYKTQYQVYIQSYPEGSDHVEFDGSPITTPYTSGWFDSGLNRSVEATNVTVTANQERYNWSSWSDGKAINHNITIDGEAYTSYFSHEWYFKVDSLYGSPTGQEWYSDGDSTVNSTVTSPSSGHDVTGWIGTGSLTSGDTTGTNGTGTFSITEYSTCTWVWSYGPTFDSFSVSDSSVKPHQVFTVSAVLSDETGNTDFVNATLGLSGDLVLLWENATDTFSIYADPNGYATLHAGSARTVLTATSIRSTWELSLNEEFPYGGVSVIEANTKVYDSADLMDSGSYANLFLFQEEEAGKGRSFVSPTIPSAKQFVEDVVSPTIFSLTSNMFTMFLLVSVGLGCVLSYRMDNPVWMVLAGAFGVLVGNFFLLFMVVPHYAELSFLESYLLRLPALELSTYSLAAQGVLQVVVVGFVLVAFLVPIFLVAKNAG